MWQLVVRDTPAGLLSSLDMGELRVYCVAFGIWFNAAAEVEKQGAVVLSPVKGEPMQNPYLSILNRQAEIMLKAGANLGLSPTSRAKLAVPEAPPDNPFRDFA